MFNRRKGTLSPSIPRKVKRIIKDKLQVPIHVPIAVGATSDTRDECTDEHITSGSSQEWGVIENCSEEVSTFTSEDGYSPVEQLRCEEFSSGDNITDRIVIPSSKSLLDVDSDDLEYFRDANPVAASTQIFPEATFSEDETYHFGYFKHAKHVNACTTLLPEAPFFEDIKDGDDYFKLPNPKASSTRILPEASLAEEEIGIMSKLKPLTGCRSVDLSSIAAVSSPIETFESDIEHTPPKNEKYPKDKEMACLIDAQIVSLNHFSINNSKTPKISSESESNSVHKLSVRASSKECSISNVGSRSSHNVIDSVTEDLTEGMGSRTNSFINSSKGSKGKLSNIQRKGTVTNSILESTKFRRLKDISNHDLKLPARTFISTRNDSVQPENQTFLKDVPMCPSCLSKKQDVQRYIKVMKPSYRSDVPIDVLCSIRK